MFRPAPRLRLAGDRRRRCDGEGSSRTQVFHELGARRPVRRGIGPEHERLDSGLSKLTALRATSGTRRAGRSASPWRAELDRLPRRRSYGQERSYSVAVPVAVSDLSTRPARARADDRPGSRGTSLAGWSSPDWRSEAAQVAEGNAERPDRPWPDQIESRRGGMRCIVWRWNRPMNGDKRLLPASLEAAERVLSVALEGRTRSRHVRFVPGFARRRTS